MSQTAVPAQKTQTSKNSIKPVLQTSAENHSKKGSKIQTINPRKNHNIPKVQKESSLWKKSPLQRPVQRTRIITVIIILNPEKRYMTKSKNRK